MPRLTLAEILYTQGFGTRRVCAGLIQQGWVAVHEGNPSGPGTVCRDAALVFEANGLWFQVQGVDWPYRERAYVMVHKPAGIECSQKPSAHPSVYTLLPAPLRQRPSRGGQHGVQSVGRLDQDTTGLLLLTDDGAFLHRMASPKHHVPKVYEVTAADPVTPEQVRRLLAGVVLDDDPKPVRAAACAVVGSHRMQLTLTQGKYHQVKRMLAAMGNRVLQLHRSRVGGLVLPPDLQPGQWRWLSQGELNLVQQTQLDGDALAAAAGQPDGCAATGRRDASGMLGACR